MGLSDQAPEGATPIDPDESEGLRIALATQGELNAFEAIGILEATTWASGNRRFLNRLLTDQAFRDLHRRMFGRTWRWAGQYRRTQKSIGVEAFRISTELRQLLDDVQCWLEFESYPPAEILARFHHRLVFIHPFVNGNGRFARLATDLLCERQGWPVSRWGAGDPMRTGEIRRIYIEALKQADANDYVPLLEFMAS